MLCYSPTFFKGTVLLPRERICYGIRSRVILWNCFDLFPTRCISDRSCSLVMGELTTIVDFTSCVSARLAAFLSPLCSSFVAQARASTLRLAERVPFDDSTRGIRAASLLQTVKSSATPAFWINNPFIAFAEEVKLYLPNFEFRYAGLLPVKRALPFTFVLKRKPTCMRNVFDRNSRDIIIMTTLQ